MKKNIVFVLILIVSFTFLSCDRGKVPKVYDIQIIDNGVSDLQPDSLTLNFEIVNNTEYVAYSYVRYSNQNIFDTTTTSIIGISSLNGNISISLKNEEKNGTIYYQPFVIILNNEEKDTILGEVKSIDMPEYPCFFEDEMTTVTGYFSIKGSNFMNIDTSVYEIFTYRIENDYNLTIASHITDVVDTSLSVFAITAHVWQKYTTLLIDKDLIFNSSYPNDYDNNTGIIDSLKINLVGSIKIEPDTVNVGEILTITIFFGNLKEHFYFNGTYIEKDAWLSDPMKFIYIIDDSFGTGKITVTGNHTNNNGETFEYGYYQNKNSFYINPE